MTMQQITKFEMATHTNGGRKLIKPYQIGPYTVGTVRGQGVIAIDVRNRQQYLDDGFFLDINVRNALSAERNGQPNLGAISTYRRDSI